MLKCRQVLAIILIFGLSASSNILAQKPTHSKDETQRFHRFAAGYLPETTEDYWYSINGLEQLLRDYPNTFLKGDIAVTLLERYSHVTDDPTLLMHQAEDMLALRMYAKGAYETAAKVLVDKSVRSEKTVLFAQKALEDALAGQKEWDNYGSRELYCREWLARAYQLVGQHDNAVSEMKKVIQGWAERNDLGAIESASRQGAVDRTRVELLQLYVDQKAWELAYTLACELVQTSVSRNNLLDLWGQAYAGKHGSALGIEMAYNELKSAWVQQVAKTVEKERISRPVPTFAVETLEGKTIRSEDLKGKVTVVTFWAGWCSPCIQELPHLQQLKQEFREVEFLAINIDQDNSARRDMIVSNRFGRARNLTYVLGDLDVRKAFGSEEIPYTCIIDQNGQIRYERKGLSADFRPAITHQLNWLVTENAKP
jgi:thiol-disulfide isomerase/thioredoxin